MFYGPAARLEQWRDQKKEKHLSLDLRLIVSKKKKHWSCWQAHAGIAFGILPGNDIYLNLRKNSTKICLPAIPELDKILWRNICRQLSGAASW